MNIQLSNTLITVISGVLVYIISQWFSEFVIRPIQSYKNLKAEISKTLILYAPYYFNPQVYLHEKDGDFVVRKEISCKIRELAAAVASFAEVKPKHIWVFYAIPCKKRLLEASCNLVGLSNSLFATMGSENQYIEHNKQYCEKINRSMRISHK